MSSLFMGTVVTSGVPADEATVRSTATPYYRDSPPAEQDSTPDPGEFVSDPNPNLGLAPRQMASKWHEGERVAHQDDIVATQNVSNQVIAQQVSTSGTAASRESSGVTHKNLSYAEGIEPVFDLGDPNHKMGNTYFVREPRNVQDTTNPSMSVPPDYDHSLQGNISAYGKVGVRDAAQSAVYNTWWNGGS